MPHNLWTIFDKYFCSGHCQLGAGGGRAAMTHGLKEVAPWHTPPATATATGRTAADMAAAYSEADGQCSSGGGNADMLAGGNACFRATMMPPLHPPLQPPPPPPLLPPPPSTLPPLLTPWAE